MDTRRLLLLSVFFFAIFMLWQNWLHHQAGLRKPGAAAPASSVAGLPVPSALTVPAAATVPSSDSAAAFPHHPPNPAPGAAAATLRVRSDLFVADFSALGGSLVRLELLKFRPDDYQGNYVLLDPQHAYAAQSGLLGDGLPNHKAWWQFAPGASEMAATDNEMRLNMSAKAAPGVSVTRSYIFRRNSYLIDVEYIITNNSPHPINAAPYFQLARDDKELSSHSSMMPTFTGPAFYSAAGKFQKLTFSDITKGKKPSVTQADNGWVAMIQHYFVSAWLPQGNSEREFYVSSPAAGQVTAGVLLKNTVIAPGTSGEFKVSLYAGPQEQDKLEQVAPGFNLVVDYGWLTIVAAPLFWLLQTIHKFTANWGWSIVVLTLLIKLLFFPLSAASYKSMAKMRLLTPRLMKLKETYGDDKRRLNLEMMEMYKREKVNPLGGCLPILVQIPVFIALYWVLLGSVEMRQAPWLGWIKDLSAADPYYILPLIMGATMFIQTKLNPTPPDPIQARVMTFMPFIFTAMFLTFPSGLVLYWTVNNLLSIAQQWQINRMIEASGLGNRQ